MQDQREKLTVSEAAQIVKKTIGRRVHPSTIRRWCMRGLADYEGDQIVLPCTQVGGRRLIDMGDLNDFLEAVVWSDTDFDEDDTDAEETEEGRGHEIGS